MLEIIFGYLAEGKGLHMITHVVQELRKAIILSNLYACMHASIPTTSLFSQRTSNLDGASQRSMHSLSLYVYTKHYTYVYSIDFPNATSNHLGWEKSVNIVSSICVYSSNTSLLLFPFSIHPSHDAASITHTHTHTHIYMRMDLKEEGRNGSIWN